MELPWDAAKKAYPYLTYGSLVTVIGPLHRGDSRLAVSSLTHDLGSIRLSSSPGNERSSMA